MELDFDKPKRRRMRRRVAVVAATLMSVTGVAGASVLIQNFMSAEFDGSATACLIKTTGDDTGFDTFDFTLQTTTVDGVALTQEHIDINGIKGDRVLATEVYVIENNCTEDLDVSIVDGVQAGNWVDRHLEVHLGTVIAPVGYPTAAGSTGWDTSPLIFEDTGPTTTATNVVTIPAGDSVPVGMVVSTGDAVTAVTGTATWTVQAEWTP